MLQYCSIIDAWGENKITTNYKDYMIDINNNIEKFDNNLKNSPNLLNNDSSPEFFEMRTVAKPSGFAQQDYSEITKPNPPQQRDSSNNHSNINSWEKNNNFLYMDTTNNKTLLCDDYIIHIKSCKICQDKIKNYLRPNIIDNLYSSIDNNKDIIVLILIGICILLFFNLIMNITK
jgi:hypothetical protein|uniref:Uncharacterized protein n=1 Tax=viral metagenome TaxID=1070528 RepID=A0A6C0EHD0_9ZZZZ